MSEGPKGQPVRLRIRSCTVGYQGVNKRGDDYTIYEIQAAREDGEVITDKKLRSFEELPVGDDLLDLTVVPFNSEKHGLSFTLSRKTKVSKTAELQAKVTELTGRLERVEGWIRKHHAEAGGATAPSAAPPPQAQPAASGAQADLDARFGAEAPF